MSKSTPRSFWISLLAAAALLLSPAALFAQDDWDDWGDDDDWGDWDDEEDDWDDDEDDWDDDEDDDDDEDEEDSDDDADEDEDWDDWGDEDEWEEEDDWSDWDDGTNETDSGSWDLWEDEDEVAGPRTVTGLFVPSDVLTPELADELTNAVMQSLQELADMEDIPIELSVMPNDGLRDEFEIMGAELAFECAFDPICLGRYGGELGLDLIVIGRVVDEGGNWATTVDLFDARTSGIRNYEHFDTAASVTPIADSMTGRMMDLFEIRQGPGEEDIYVRPAWQTPVAITTGVLGVGMLALGTVFGLQANSIQSDIDDGRSSPTAGGSLYTQNDANDDIDRGQSRALMANIFFGTGVALAGVSTLLFVIDIGSDVDTSADMSEAPGPRLGFGAGTPATGLGLSGTLEF